MYFIADLHFGHKNIISYDGRPFTDVEEMAAVLIQNWNETVLDEDEVYVLGDLGFSTPAQLAVIFQQLSGRKHWIIGNHDQRLLSHQGLRSQFCEVAFYLEVPFEPDRKIVLSHYPVACFNGHLHNWIHFYGHVHQSFEEDFVQDMIRKMAQDYGKPMKMANVGCMMPYMAYTPRSLAELLDYFGW